MAQHFSITHVTARKGDEAMIFMAGQTCRQKKIKAGGVSDFDAFSDSLILGFTPMNEHGDVWVKLARPHLMVTCQGTTSPGFAMQVEEFMLSLTRLWNTYDVVDTHPRTSGHFNDPRNASDDEKITVTLGK